MTDKQRWQGHITYTDDKGVEHRILATDHGWKLRIQDRMSGKLIHEENGCVQVTEAMKRDERWSEANR